MCAGASAWNRPSSTRAADILLAFEQLEAARYLPYLKKDGVVVTNTQKIDPMPVITGAADYRRGCFGEDGRPAHA